MKICCTFDSLRILQSDNSHELYIIERICKLTYLWQDLVFVNFRPHHLQNKGSIKRKKWYTKYIYGMWN